MLDPKRVNFPLLLLSFMLSVLLWSHVKQTIKDEQPPGGTFSFSVELKPRNLPPNSVIVGTIPPRVNFTAIGPIDEQRKINPANLSAFVDLSERPKDNRYLVRLEATTDYRVQWQPMNLRIPITIEKEISRKFTVDVEPIGDFKLQNYRYDGSTCDPASITVTGAESVIDSIKRVRAYLNLGTVESDNSQRAKVELLDAKDSPVTNASLSSDTVVVSAVIAPRPPQRSLLLQPVWAGAPEFGSTVSDYQFTPAQVSVEGPADVLANLSVINTKPINITGIRETTVVPVELDLPPGIRLTKQEPVTVKVFIKQSGQSPNTPGNR
jgi:YbbR domain-containing protein